MKSHATDLRMPWLAFAVAFLAMAAVVVQLWGLRLLFVPWYLPVLGTLALIFSVLGLRQKRSIARVFGLVFTILVAGVGWICVGVMRIPEYDGPGRVGQPFPVFTARLADGQAFGNGDLAMGRPSVVLLFRGYW